MTTPGSTYGGYSITPTQTQTNNPLGVPKTYHAPTTLDPGMYGLYAGVTGGEIPTPTTQFGTPIQTQPYGSGAELGPIAHPDTIPVLKQQLLAAGLLTDKTVGNPGVWDMAAVNAYRDVLTFANRYGMTATDAMTYFVNNPKAAAAVPSIDTGMFFPEYNPANIATGFENVAQGLTGSESGQMLPQFTQAFQAAENQAAQGKDVAKVAKSGALARGQLGAGVYEQKPTPTDFATQYLIQHDPSQVAAYGVASRMQEFLNAVGVR